MGAKLRSFVSQLGNLLLNIQKESERQSKQPVHLLFFIFRAGKEENKASST